MHIQPVLKHPNINRVVGGHFVSIRMPPRWWVGGTLRWSDAYRSVSFRTSLSLA